MLYVIIISLAVAIIYGPQLWTRRILARHNQHEYFSGNGFDLARLLLEQNGLNHVGIEPIPVGNHYDPEAKVIRLSADDCGRRSLTAVVLAAHEVGHALQDHTNYPPLQTRTRLVVAATRLEKLGAVLLMLIPVLTLATRVPAAGLLLLAGGLATLCIPLVIHLLTLPTEFDASFRRALPILINGRYIPPEDVPAARRILLACALTYVAAALAGLLNIWRWIRLLRR